MFKKEMASLRVLARKTLGRASFSKYNHPEDRRNHIDSSEIHSLKKELELYKQKDKRNRIDSAELHSLKEELDLYKRFQMVVPGHFYSPIVDLNSQGKVDRMSLKEIENSGINLNLDCQYSLLFSTSFQEIYEKLPFSDTKSSAFRYFYTNPAFSYSDAICLFFMLVSKSPSKVIEVGSGYSSALMLDTFENFFEVRPEITFIEPYPDLLLSLMNQDDKKNCSILSQNLQEIPLETFKILMSSDILFIDSTHIAKAGSDVNYIFSKILPILNKGVIIHFHDIFLDFEYPEIWIKEGRNWNESYVLRSFLQCNNDYEILLFNSLVNSIYSDEVRAKYPLMSKNHGGGIWIRKK